MCCLVTQVFDYEMMNSDSSNAFENIDSDDEFLVDQPISENIVGHILIKNHSFKNIKRKVR